MISSLRRVDLRRPTCPTAIATRPQLASPPKTAVLNSGELAIAKAAFSASASVAAPRDRDRRRTSSRPRRPARSSARARRTTSWTAAATASNAAESGARSRARPRRRAPSACTCRWWRCRESTVMRLKVRATADAQRRVARRRRQRRVGGEEGEHRGHVRLDHAAALGHAADGVASGRRRRTRRASCLANVSVVMIASAAASPVGGVERVDRLGDARERPGRAAAATPITPVEPTTTSPGSQPSASARASAIARASAMPGAPVHALALPALTTTARARPPAMCSRRDQTGAAAIVLVVKTAAAGTAARRRGCTTSRLPDFLMPALTPAPRSRAARVDAALGVARTRMCSVVHRCIALTYTTGDRARSRPAVSAQPEHDVGALHRLARRALDRGCRWRTRRSACATPRRPPRRCAPGSCR